jgi:branched-chain amino acid transport system substrate-binding protein
MIPDAAAVCAPENKGEGCRCVWSRNLARLTVLAALSCPLTSPAAEMRGVTATEIKIGQTMPYRGPVSAFGALARGRV